MKVFISHSSMDSEKALDVKKILDRNHISSYLDLKDGTLPRMRGSSEITEKIITELEQCSVLLGIITSRTKSSWWVPFEIGVARTNLMTVASYSSLSDLPEYLQDCPIFKDDIQFEKYLKKLKYKESLFGKKIIGSESLNENFSIKASIRKSALNEVYKFEKEIITDIKNSNY